MSTPAFENLRDHQGQADMDGVMVTVSRQAVEEVLTEYAELEQQLEEMRTLADEQTDDLAKAGLQLAALREEKHSEYQRAQYYRAVLQEMRDNTPAGQPQNWPHHHWYLHKTSEAINRWR